MATLTSYNICNQLEYFILDYVTNNNRLIGYVSSSLASKGILNNLQDYRPLYDGYIMKLAVFAFLLKRYLSVKIQADQFCDTWMEISISEPNSWKRFGHIVKLYDIMIYIMGSMERSCFLKACIQS